MEVHGQHHHRRRVIAAGIAGNVMEWYDFAVYGYFARTIGQLYFPSDDAFLSLMAAFGAFAALVRGGHGNPHLRHRPLAHLSPDRHRRLGADAALPHSAGPRRRRGI